MPTFLNYSHLMIDSNIKSARNLSKTFCAVSACAIQASCSLPPPHATMEFALLPQANCAIDESVRESNIFRIRGWIEPISKASIVDEKIVVSFSAADKSLQMSFPAGRVPRPDVAIHLNNPALDQAGFIIDNLKIDHFHKWKHPITVSVSTTNYQKKVSVVCVKTRSLE
jgi:hypothetical protein